MRVKGLARTRRRLNFNGPALEVPAVLTRKRAIPVPKPVTPLAPRLLLHPLVLTPLENLFLRLVQLVALLRQPHLQLLDFLTNLAQQRPVRVPFHAPFFIQREIKHVCTQLVAEHRVFARRRADS